jgi:predicted small metal-binding protein
MSAPELDWVLNCPCGTRLEAGSEDEIVEVSLKHLREKHPDMEYERHHILFMAESYPKRS